MPRSPSTVRVTGVGRDHLTGEPASSGSTSTTLVHVGGGPADVDDHHVARPDRSASRPRASSSTPVSTTSGVAPVTIAAKSVRRRQVLAADDVRQEHLADRGPGRVGASTPIRGTTLSASDVRHARQDRRHVVLRLGVAGHDDRSAQPASTRVRAAVEEGLGVAAVGAAGQQHDVGRVVCLRSR